MLVRLASIAVSLGLLLLVPKAAPAAVDLSGPWYVALQPDFPGQPPGDLVKCHWDVTQSGTTLIVRYACSGPTIGAGSTGTYTGTIDPQDGSFAIADASSICLGGAATYFATAHASSATFTGLVDCNAVLFGAFTASRCQNGALDAGEACDNGIDDDGDCCAASCQLLAAGATCGDDGDGNACTGRVCDGAGSCGTGAPLEDGTSCGGEPCFEGFGTCRSGTCSARPMPAGTPCETDGNACTVEACNAAGVCASGGCSACCDDSSGSCVPAYDATCEQPIAAHSRVAMSLEMGSLAWTWGKGNENDFGAPQASGATLCAYDGLTKQLIAADTAAPGTCSAPPCWKASGSSVRYRGNRGSTLRSITLHEGASTARITAQVRRHPFLAYWQTWPIAAPLRVQLKIGDRCWESTFLHDDERHSSRRRYVASGGASTPVP